MDRNDILAGGKHRYHIESAVESNGCGTVYRAFSRRRVGQRIVRRYYAVLERADGVPSADFEEALAAMVSSVPYDVFENERFDADGRSYVVLAKGKAPRQPNRRWQSLQNHGYLMLLLAALILILMIVKFFQSPTSPVV